ncbi:MAG: DNA polymerase IV [Lachnospiraceae bacterium]|jgi:DNA polymerase-4|nr:DNA polymerase IV [Lachnospiraceae bacterium]
MCDLAEYLPEQLPERSILHSDMNSFYASVEAMLDPKLRGKAVAVCGSQETRHGIVLAKSQKAKKAGVKTGMAVWEARQCCPDLIVVPPQYDAYIKYSKLAHEIYLRYTDQMEPFGMDECWLDLTGTGRDPVQTADEIRETVKSELGLTVSIGVSFNKIFAKLGSDMKKPDAVTVITRQNFRSLVWPLAASEILYCGRATTRRLARYGVLTIGDIAATPPELLQDWLGINGLALWRYAAGLDCSRVMTDGWEAPVKSIGHGVTCVSDLLNDGEVWHVMLELAQEVGHRLRSQDFLAGGVQLTLRDNGLLFTQYQAKREAATRSAMEIAQDCFRLFRENYRWETPVRAICVRAVRLVSSREPQQLGIFDDAARREKQDRLEAAIDDIRRRYGKRAVYNACLMGDIKVHEIGASEVTMPGMMYV